MDNNGQDDQNVNNEQAQSSFDTNTSDTQNKESSVNAKNGALTQEEVSSSEKGNVADKQDDVQASNTLNEVQEQVIVTNAHTEPENQNVNNELEKLLSSIEKGETPKKLEDAQIKNVLGSIKAQMTSATSPADFIRLASALAALASSTNNPELLEQIKSVQAVVTRKIEIAEQIISSDIAAENLEVQEQQDPEMARKHLEHEERKTRIDKNWAEYEKIEKESRDRLIANNKFLDQIHNEPNSLMEEQKRLARGQYHNKEELQEAERKAQQDIDFARRTHELHRDLNHAIEHEQEQLNILTPKIEVEQNHESKDELLQKKQQYEDNISSYQEKLEKHINPAIAELDLEREKLLKVVETHPDLVKERIKVHFKGNITRYQEMKTSKSDPKALEEMEQLIKKAGLENELSVAEGIKEYKQSTLSNNTDRNADITIPVVDGIQKNDERQKTIKIDLNKAINKVHAQYQDKPIPREETDKIVNIVVHNMGYADHAKSMAEKKQVKEIDQQLTNNTGKKIELGQLSPSMAKFGVRADAMNKSKEGRNI